MGHLKEKYTKEYFTGKDINGNDAGYGATMAYDEKGNLILRGHDKKILDQVNFKGTEVLSLGVGRGEELFFAKQSGASKCTGVDFSENAIEIAQEVAIKQNLSSVEFINEDALKFLNNYIQIENYKKFDVIIMFDFVEHVPRAELKQIFDIIAKIINKKGIVVINTPSYKFDNDVIADGFDERNLENCLDISDTHPATAGMHCNKYTTLSLQKFLSECGFINVTENHFFVKNENLTDKFNSISFAERWKFLYGNNFPVESDYVDDEIEYPYSDAVTLKWKKFNEGNLAGISMYVNEEYASIAYHEGNIDTQMIDDMIASNFPEESVIFDIGACVGVDSFVFAKLLGNKCKVIAFEPNEYNRNRFFLNLSHNPDFFGKINIFSNALGDMNGTLRMNISANIDGGHSSTSRIHQAHSKISDELLPSGFFETNIEVLMLDEFVEKNNIFPSIMKIDIEGAEHMMLAGAMKTIEKFKPVIYMELHSEYCALICYKLLNSLNYSVSVINEEDDNRLMIKAMYDDSKNINVSHDFLRETQRNLNSSFETIRNLNMMSKKILDINKRYQSENDNLRSKLERIAAHNQKLEIEHNHLVNCKSVRFGNIFKKYLKKVKMM